MLLSTRRVVAALTLTATGLAVLAATPASADQVAILNTDPIVSGPSFTMPGAPQVAFEPDGAASDEVYQYNVTVADAETLNDLTTVTVCLYHSLNEVAGPGEGDSTCASINPANTVLLTWTQASDAFTISAGSSTYWALATGTVSNHSGALTDTTAAFEFRFTVSEAMREGTWTAKVIATDTSAAFDVDSAVTVPVSAYSAITTRVTKDFGTLAAGVPNVATDSPTVISNGATTLSMTAGNFDFGAYELTLKTDGATSVMPAAGQVTYDCNQAGVFDQATAIRIGSSATSLLTATASGTAELGTAVSNTCRIVHGGGRPTGTYAFTVVNTIVNA